MWFKKLIVNNLFILLLSVNVQASKVSDCLNNFADCQNYLSSLTIKAQDESIKTLIRQCDSGEGFICYSLGMWFNYKEDQISAEKYLRKGCSLKYFKSCMEGGYLLERNYRSSAADDLFIFACAFPEGGKGCQAVGQSYREKGDYLKAFKFYNMSCDAGFAEACIDAADISVFSQMPKKNLDLKFNLLKKSCLLENSAGCFRWAEMLLDREYPEAAKEAYKKACLAGSEAGCEEFKNLNGGGLFKEYQQYLSKKKKEVFNYFKELFPVGPKK